MIYKIDELIVDEGSYPRTNTDWQVILKYAQAMEMGANFPEIEIAIINGKKYVCDGVHRLDARKRNGEEFIACKVNKNIKSLDDLYLIAIERNLRHGKVFTQTERRNIILKLKDMKINEATISALVGIPLDKMKLYLGSKYTHTVSGKEVVLKKPIEHLTNEKVDDNIEQIQASYTGSSITLKLDNIISMVENDLLDLENKVVLERLKTLKKLLNKVLKGL